MGNFPADMGKLKTGIGNFPEGMGNFLTGVGKFKTAMGRFPAPVGKLVLVHLKKTKLICFSLFLRINLFKPVSDSIYVTLHP